VATSDADGAYAEYCLAPADLVCQVPDGVSAEVSASAILKGQTAHLLIKSVYPVGSGDTVPLHAGAGGVGLILVSRSTFDASLASLAVRGTLALYGASSGPVPPVDPQRLNAAGSVYLTRPLRPHFLRTYDEFAWRTDELIAAVQAGTITVTTGDRYRLRDAAQAHSDLEGRKTHGSTVLIP
jgi:NADPH2:quinone reductase